MPEGVETIATEARQLARQWRISARQISRRAAVSKSAVTAMLADTAETKFDTLIAIHRAAKTIATERSRAASRVAVNGTRRAAR